jgi:hypothetical protein
MSDGTYHMCSGILTDGLRETCATCNPRGAIDPNEPTTILSFSAKRVVAATTTPDLRNKDFTLEDDEADAADAARSRREVQATIDDALAQTARMAKDAEASLAQERTDHAETRAALESALRDLEGAKGAYDTLAAGVKGAKSLRAAHALVGGGTESAD